MEYEVNQVLITPLGGDLEKPVYTYQVHLYALTHYHRCASFDARGTITVMYLKTPKYPYNAISEPTSLNVA